MDVPGKIKTYNVPVFQFDLLLTDTFRYFRYF